MFYILCYIIKYDIFPELGAMFSFQIYVPFLLLARKGTHPFACSSRPKEKPSIHLNLWPYLSSSFRHTSESFRMS